MSYTKSMEIELFIRETLKVKQGSKIYNDLQEAYNSIVLCEQQGVSITQRRKQVKNLLKYLSLVMDKILKKQPTLAVQFEEMRDRIPSIMDSSEILSLYNRIRLLSD